MSTNEVNRREWRFYTSLFLGFIMLMVGCFCPPLGEIADSILIAGGMILTISAGCIGINFAEIIHQFSLLKMSSCLPEQEKEKLIKELKEELENG